LHWRKRTARFFSAAPELLPLVTGLVVHRLANVQEGIFVGCVVAGIGLAARTGAVRPFVFAVISWILFVASFATGGLVAESQPILAGGTIGVAGLLAGGITLAAGLTALDTTRRGSWTPVRIAGVCLAIAVIGLAFAGAVALGGDRLAGADASWGSTWL